MWDVRVKTERKTTSNSKAKRGHILSYGSRGAALFLRVRGTGGTGARRGRPIRSECPGELVQPIGVVRVLQRVRVSLGTASRQPGLGGYSAFFLASHPPLPSCCTWGGTTGVDRAVAVNSWGTRLIWPGPLGTCGSGATSNRGSQTVLSVSDDMAPLHDQHASLFTPLFCSLHGVTGVRYPV